MAHDSRFDHNEAASRARRHAGGHHHGRGRGSHRGELGVGVRALQSLRVEKGRVDAASIDLLVDTFDNGIGRRLG